MNSCYAPSELLLCTIIRRNMFRESLPGLGRAAFPSRSPSPVPAPFPALPPPRPPARPGGYEYEFLVNPVPERFLCNICMKVLRDARLTECCGQHFCDSCLTTWLQQQKTCPHCRKENFVSIINKEKIREINELRIRCTNSKKGCDWVGELGALIDHKKSESNGCGYVTVQCTNVGRHKTGCILRMERRFLTNHKENECKYRPYTCEHCGYKDTYKGIAIGYKKKRTTKLYLPFREDTESSSHYSTCDQYPLKCPNECGETNIKRRDMKGHRDICPLEPLDCPFKDVGCTKKIQRKDMKEHMENNTQHLLRSHKKLMKAYEQLKKSHQMLRERVKDLEEGTSSY